MKPKFIAQFAWMNITHSKLRTWLTIVGIVIGVAAVVLIVAIGNGLEANVQSQLGSFGADLITVSPGFARAGAFGFRAGGDTTSSVTNNITVKDLQAVQLTKNIKEVTGTISGRTSIVFYGQSITSQFQGVDPAVWKDFNNNQFDSGRDLTSSDSNSVVLGNRIATQAFNRPVTVNSLITINGKGFRVVGILAASGSFGGSDNAIIMPISQARTVLTGFEPDQFSSIIAKVNDLNNIDTAVADLQQNLLLSRHETSKQADFTVTATQSVRAQIESVTQSISFFLGGIAAISLLVGAIGIANTMFMAVLERTKQIGLLKALGTTNSEITKIFLLESGLLGFAGGLIGCVLSLGISLILSQLGVGLALPTGGRGRTSIALITPELVLFALFFSAIIGMAAGYVPAKQASKLQPVEALRYE